MNCKGSKCQTQKNASSMARQLASRKVGVMKRPDGGIIYKSIPQTRTAAQKRAARMEVFYKQLGRSHLKTLTRKAIIRKRTLPLLERMLRDRLRDHIYKTRKFGQNGFLVNGKVVDYNKLTALCGL